MVTDIDIVGRFRRLVDLTHTLDPGFPGFGADEVLRVETATDPDGFHVGRWSLPEHLGTHLDAPRHCAADGRTLERIDLADLLVPAVVVDVRAQVAADPDYALTVADLRGFEARHGELPPRCAVLMWSGWDARVGDPARYRNCDERGVLRFPGFGRDAACFLRDARDVRGLGVDTLSLDPGRSTTYDVHRAWLPHDRWGLESLCNLGALPPRGALLVVGALKVRGGTGGPVRALALVP
jgi:kynurenine formamidase